MASKQLVVSTGFGTAPFASDASLTERVSFNNLVLGSLVSLEESYTLQASILESWHWDFGRKEYVLKIPKGVKFHDGKLLTAEHVEFGLLRWLFMKNGKVLAHYLRAIEGVEAVKPGDRFVSGKVKGVRVVDAQTLTIKLKVPDTGFMYQLAYPEYAPVQIESLEPDLATWKGLPVGCGPFRVAKLDQPSKRVHLTRVGQGRGNDLERIVFDYSSENWLKSDLILWLHDYRLKDFANHDLVKYSGSIDLGYLFRFNYDSPLARNLDVRRAIDLVLDRDTLAAVNDDTVPMWRILPSTFWGLRHLNLKRDVSRAKDHLQKVDPELRRHPIRIRMRNHDDPARSPFAKIISANLAEIGLKAQFVDGGGAKLGDPGDYDLGLMWIGIGDILDPLEQYSFFMPESAFPFLHTPTDVMLVQRYRDAEFAPSFDVRVEHTRRLADYFQDQSYALPLFGKTASVWVRKGVRVDLGHQRSSLMFHLDRVQWR